MSTGSCTYPSRIRAVLAVFILLFLSISCAGGGGGGGEATDQSTGATTETSGTTTQPVSTAEVTLAWDASASPDVLGYKLYCGTERELSVRQRCWQ
ncbi:MAG TPA: hypothetical protein DCR97_03400 [Deltaproteobacteria bacterium]|nr:hypothetical protein [Deltaproteobacteria bacterium]